MNDFARVFLKANEEKEILQGFPWVFDNEIASVKRIEQNGKWKATPLFECGVSDGEGVEVYSKAGNFLGTGIINRSSRIAVRLISSGKAQMVYDDAASFWAKRVRDAVNIRRMNYHDSDSYRLVFGESDFIPGFIAERYCDENQRVYIVVQFLSLSSEVFRNQILTAIKNECTPYGIYERSDAAVREKEGLKKKSGWIGAQRESVITIIENGVKLIVDIANGQKTGYFLDQKDNRKLVSPLCHGKRVLDAFSHTGAFGLNAAKAGAREVICVEISSEAIAIMQRNIEANGVGTVMKAEQGDAFELLRQYESAGRKFDVLILDPPAFAKSAAMVQKAYGGYKEINLRAMRLLTAGGLLVTCSCSSFFDSNTFYSMLMHAAKDSRRRVQVLEKRGAGPDHPVLLGYPRSEYLKCAVLRVM